MKQITVARARFSRSKKVHIEQADGLVMLCGKFFAHREMSQVSPFYHHLCPICRKRAGLTALTEK